MKKILYIILLLGIGQLVYAQKSVGDNLGNHKAILDLNMNSHSINNLSITIGSPAMYLVFHDGNNFIDYAFSDFVSGYLGGYAHLATKETFTGIKTFQAATTFGGNVQFNVNINADGVSTFSQDISVNSLTVGAGTGLYSTVLGNQALNKNAGTNLGGRGNTAIGNQSLLNNLGDGNLMGSNNTAVGYLSGQNNTLGSNNVFVGYNSGTNITSGNYNTIVGSPLSSLGNLNNNIVLADGQGHTGLKIDAISGITTLNGALNKLNVLSTLSGTNNSAGKTLLSSGTVTITTTVVTPDSIIFLTRQSPSGNSINSELSIGGIIGGTSFVINSYETPGKLQASDNSIIGWLIIN